MAFLEPLSLEPLPDKKDAAGHTFPEIYPNNSNQGAGNNRIHELERMLAETQGRAALVEQEAYDKAYAAGEKAGMELGQKRADQIIERMQHSLHEAEIQLGEMRRLSGEVAIDLAAALTQWLIGELTEQDQSRLLAMAQRSARKLPDIGKLKLAVSADDFEDFEKLIGHDHTESGMTLIAEDALPVGHVRVFSQQQDVMIEPQAVLNDMITRLKSELLQEEEDDPSNHTPE